MATVPQYQSQVSPAAIPSARLPAQTDPQAFGAGFGQAAQAIAGVAAQEAERADIMAVMDADQRSKDVEHELFNAPGTGAFTMRGRQALDLMDSTMPEYQRRLDDIANTLTPSQQRAFAQRRSRRENALRDKLGLFVAQQRESYYNDLSQAYIASAVQAAGDNAFDDAAIDSEVADARMAVLTANPGASPQVAEQLTNFAASQVHTAVINRRMVSDPDSALQYYARVEVQRTIPEAKRLQIEQQIQTSIAQSDAERFVKNLWAGSTDAAGFDMLTSAVREVESGGDPTAVSPAGAIGSMQVMPTTGPEAAALAGLPWDEDRLRNDDAYNTALGRAYLAHQMETFGHVIPALTAYNAGPGATRKWLREIGDPRTGEIGWDEWVSRIPITETREYVGRVGDVLGRLPAAGVAPSKGAMLSAVNAIPNRQMREYARSLTEHQWTAYETARKERQTAVSDQAWNLALDGVPLTQMPPQLVDQLREVPDTRKAIMKWEQTSGGPTSDWDTLYKLSQMTPEELAGYYLPNDRANLSDHHYEKWLDRQRALSTGSVSSLELNELRQQFNTYGKRILFPAADTDEDGRVVLDSDQARVAAEVYDDIWAELDAARVEGRRLGHEERRRVIERHALSRWAQDTEARARRGPFAGRAVLSELDLDAVETGYRYRVGDIPPTEVDQVKARLAELNIRDENAYISAYFTAYMVAGGGEHGERVADAFVERMIERGQ